MWLEQESGAKVVRQVSLSLMFLQNFNFICDLLLSRYTATRNLLVLYNTERNKQAVSYGKVTMAL